MEQNEEKNKNPVASTQTEEPKKEKQPLTEAQRQKRNKLIVYPLMGLLFIGSMWWIFAPSEEDKLKELQSQGFNTEMPLADGTEIIGDKTKAYELGELEARQQSRERAMQDLGDMFKGEADNDVSEDEYSLMNPGAAEEKKTEATKVQRTVQSSANAYRNLNTTLGSFYEEPKRNDEEVDELKVWVTRIQSLGQEDSWRRKWQPTPVVLPGKSHGRRSMVGYSPGGCKESDSTIYKIGN